jgi:hypothetical protein
MRGGIQMKKPNIKSVVGISVALIAGITAFISNISEQKKDERIDKMDERIKMLESSKEAE